MSAEQQSEALEVLREVWRGQSRAPWRNDSEPDLDCGETRSCKRMSEAGVGYEDFGGATESERRAAWRARLEREGKFTPSGGSLRDILRGS